MTDGQILSSGKTHRDENCPVASILIHPRHRPAILAFYRFARAADDIADHPLARPDEKLRLLESFRASLLGASDAIAVAVALRETLKARSLTTQHAADLLEAFRRDVTVSRYRDWEALMDYCRYSAMPVGRFVLDVHGESETLWPVNDSLCAALQVINHLQDCGDDYRERNRVYIPLDALRSEMIDPSVLAAKRATSALRRVVENLASRNAALLEKARPFASLIKSPRLAFEVTVIQRLAEDLNIKVTQRDPLFEPARHRNFERTALALGAAGRFVVTRFRRIRAATVLARGGR
jgi:squalene synthase HpnC